MSSTRRSVLLALASALVLLVGLAVGLVSSISHDLPDVDPSESPGVAGGRDAGEMT